MGGVYVAFNDTTGDAPDQGGLWRPANIPGPQTKATKAIRGNPDPPAARKASKARPAK